jgi:hypothetical protein
MAQTSVADPDPHSICHLDPDPASECGSGSSYVKFVPKDEIYYDQQSFKRKY